MHINIYKVEFTKLGMIHTEYVLGTEQQTNDYAIGVASSMGCTWNMFNTQFDPKEFNVSGIDSFKVLVN